ncbi:uncharacterized protein LOC104456877 [Eucalyptus grandis]|uniref:uncharacterized protein LOC104456877 n=1 Tax=Eucalyptus grandis TaxID=71139 RepID=UPI00192EBEFB|nr:uncharacterized protein LOC104456877 [Eucalyptus grandis]XP_010070061.2 uncharacterized protein LOC104456877 [Eucalyptus grandis]
MALSSSPSPSAARRPGRSLGLLANARKHKHSFIQFAAMTGILLLSLRSLGQKYRINNLLEDTSALREERDSLADRMGSVKRDLRREASLDSTGFLAARLRLLFGDEE